MALLPRRRLSAPRLLLLAAAVACTLAFAPLGGAQSDHSTVIRVLRTGRDMRARARAALALGSSNDRSVTPHLITALADRSPAVRAAAATALGRLQDTRALAALRARVSDEHRAVRVEAQQAIRRIQAANRGSPGARRARTGPRERLPSIAIVPRARRIAWPRVRYVVVIGSMENRSRFRDDSLGALLASEVNRALLVLRGVAVFQEGHQPADAQRQIQRRHLPRLRLEGSLNRVERRVRRRELSVRCEVSLMLLDDPGHNMRSILNGAATGSSRRSGRRRDQEQRLARQALTGAVRSAMQGASRAISGSAR